MKENEGVGGACEGGADHMNNGDASPGASTPLSGLLACTRTIFAL